MSEETQQSTKSLGGIRKVKVRYFFFGFFSGVIFFITFVFAGDAYMHRDFDNVTIEDFGSHDDGKYEPADYPAWMDAIVNPPAGVGPKSVYTFTCELVIRKPDAFTTTCADFGEAIFNVKWSIWSAEGAKGAGTYSLNDCDPNCAEGTRHEVPVYLWLTDTSTDGTNYYLQTLRIVPIDVYEGRVDVIRSEHARLHSDVFVEGKAFTGAEWDVSRDWKEFPNLRGNLP